MPLGTKLIAREEKTLKRSRQAQASAFQKDTDTIKNIFDATSNCKAAKAREILAEPENLKGLLGCNKENNAPCFYALHALFIVLALRDTDRKVFLNNMTDENIAILRELILIAKQRPLPDKESLNKVLTTRSTKKLTPTTQEYISNQSMILSARLTMDVADWWEDATKELDKWLNDINNFKREKISVSIENWWSLADLAQKLGCKSMGAFYIKKCELLKQKSILAAEINSWFAHKGTKKLFNPEYFAEFKKLWDETKVPNRSKISKSKALAKPQKAIKAKAPKAERKPRKAVETIIVPVVDQPKEITKVEKPVVKHGRKPRQVQNTAKTESKELKTLTDFKAFKEFIDWLAEQSAKAQNDFNTKTVDYESKLEALRAVKDSEQRVELLQQITEANTGVIESEKAFHQISEKFTQATKLFDDLKKAQADLTKMMADIQKDYCK